MGDADDWNADMDAWALSEDQRSHHLWRLHRYHRALEARAWLEYDRIQRIEVWIGLTLIAWFVISLLVMWAMS